MSDVAQGTHRVQDPNETLRRIAAERRALRARPGRESRAKLRELDAEFEAAVGVLLQAEPDPVARARLEEAQRTICDRVRLMEEARRKSAPRRAAWAGAMARSWLARDPEGEPPREVGEAARGVVSEHAGGDDAAGGLLATALWEHVRTFLGGEGAVIPRCFGDWWLSPSERSGAKKPGIEWAKKPGIEWDKEPGIDSVEEIDYSCWTEAFARYLDRIGVEGRNTAQRAREKWEERCAKHAPNGLSPRAPGVLLELWDDPEGEEPYPPWVGALAEVVWFDEVQSEIERATTLKHPSVVPHLVRVLQHPGPSRRDGTRILDGAGIPNGLVVPALSPEVVTLGMQRFGTVMFDALARWMAAEAFRMYVKDPDLVRCVEVAGGAGRLCEILGFNKSHAGSLRDLLRSMAGAPLQLELPLVEGGTTPLLADWFETKPAPGRKAVLHMELSAVFAPTFVQRFPKGHPGRALIPVLEGQPPLPRNPNQHPAALAMEWMALERMQQQSRALAERGSVEIDWVGLARRARLDPGALPGVLDLWTAGPSPRWVKFPGGRWTLGGGHGTALAVLVGGGRKRIAGSNARNARKKPH